MANPNDNIHRLYENGQKYFSLPDFDTFQKDMYDEEKRKRFYTNMLGAYTLPDFETFSKDIGVVSGDVPSTHVQPTGQPEQTAGAVTPVTDTTVVQTALPSSAEPSSQQGQPEGWKPSGMQRLAFEKQMEEATSRLAKQGDEFEQRIEAINKGNKPGAFMGERVFNPQTEQMETAYYTAPGERVSTPLKQSLANTEYHQWWENNTEAGRKSKEKRLQNEFETRLSSLWQRHNPKEGENAAEQAWRAAESAYYSAVDRNRENADMMISNFAMNSSDATAFKQMETVDNFTDRLTTHDLDALMDNAWCNLGEEGQKALIDDCYKMLRHRNPGADDLIVYNQAKEFARQQSDLRMYHLAVEKNLPKSNLEYFMRKIGDMNLVTNIAKGIAVNRIAKTGDMAAYEAANEQYRQDGHKVLDMVGMVAGFAVDPTTILSAGIGGTAARGTMWAGGRWIAGRGASTAAVQAATRKYATTMTGRLLTGVAAGAANFGTYEGLKEIETQFAHGGKVSVTDEDGNLAREGRYVNEGYSASSVAVQALHGLIMGGSIGWITPFSGNVSDKLVSGGELFGKALSGISSTAAKVGTRAGIYTGATVVEGTIFSVPEWIDGKRDGFDVWTDNMTMMAGFKATHILKSAGTVLGDLKASFDSPTNGQKNRLDFMSRLRMRMDMPSDGGLAVTRDGRMSVSLALSKDEVAELNRYGYGDLRELVESAEKTGNAEDGALITQNAPRIVSRLTDMVNDSRISEAARAKMYYYATGRKLPMSTIMRGEMIEDGSGGFIVESQGANGVITSRSFKSRKAADLELERIKRQVELNSIEIGERYRQAENLNETVQKACRIVAEENGWDVVEVYRTCEAARRDHLRGKDKELDEMRRNIINKVSDAIGEYDETAVTDALRSEINEKYGVDIDAAIRKEPNRRTNPEQTAIGEYLAELFHNKEKANPIEDANAQDLTGQRRIGQGTSDNINPDTPQNPIGRAVMKYQDRPVEVLSGRIVMTDDGTMVNNDLSDKSIVIRDINTGAIEMVAPEAILSYEQYAESQPKPQPAADDEFEQDETAAAHRKYVSGEIKIRNSDGTLTRGWLTGEVDENGNHEYYVEGDLRHMHYASDRELDAILDEYIPDEPEEQPGDQPVVDSGRPQVGVEEYDRGYTKGIEFASSLSDQDLDSVISILRGRDRLSEEDRGKLDAYVYEQQSRRLAAQPAPETENEATSENTTSENAEPSEEEAVIRDGISGTADGLREGFKAERERIGNEWLDNPAVMEAMKVYAAGATSVEDLVERAKADSRDDRTKQRLESLLEFDSTRGKLQSLLDESNTPENEQKEPMPMRKVTKKGKTWDEPEYLAVSPERSHAYIYEEAELTREQADEHVAFMAKEAEKAVKAHEKKKPTMKGSIAEFKHEEAAWEEARSQLQMEVDYWNAVKAIQEAATAEEREAARLEQEEAARWEQQKRDMDKRLRDTAEKVKDVPEAVAILENSAPQTIDEVAAWLLSGTKVLWDDVTTEGGRRLKYGVSSHTGLGNGERRKLIGLFASAEKGGVSIDRLAEDAMQEACEEFGVPYDNGEALDALISVISSAHTRGDITNYIVERRMDQAERTWAAAHEEERRQYDNWCYEQFGMSGDEFEAYEEDLAMRTKEALENFDEQDYYSRFADEILNNQRTEDELRRNQETLAGREDAAHGRGDEVLPPTQSAPAAGGRPIENEDSRGGAGDRYQSPDKTGTLSETPSGAEAVIPDRGAGYADDSRGSRIDPRSGESQKAAQQELLSQEDATNIIAKMEMSAVADPKISLSPESWQNSFGLSNAIDTPLGKVKMGEGQYQKFINKDRSEEFGMVVQTLQDPDLIFIEPSEAKEGQITERGFSYVFVKTFIRDGKKIKYYTSVSVLRDGMEVSVSSHIANKTAIMKKLQSMERVYTKDSLLPNSSEWHLAEHPTDVPDLLPTQGKSETSNRKDNNFATDKQEKGAESSAQTSENKGEQSVQAAVEAASAQVNTTPTPAQAAAGNYKKGHVTIGDFKITIENPAGSVRRGVDAEGKEWSTTMANAYGEIKGTESVDGDPLDVFLHQDMDSWDGLKVYVVDQTNTDGSFDEHKVMLGFNDKDEAMSAYLANYDKTWADTHPGLRISEVSIDDFKKWVQSSHRKTKPFADYSTISKVVNETPVTTGSEQPTTTIEGEGYKVGPKPYTTKQGKTLDTYLVTFDRDFSKEELSALRAKAKALKGWYDRDSKGWMLRSVDEAKSFAEEVAGKTEDEVADEAPLSMVDMSKPTDAPVKKVDVGSVANALKTKGETKLSDHTEPLEQPKPKKRRWISDEDADEFNNLRNDLRNHFGKGDDIVQEGTEIYGKPQPKQMDAEVLRMGTRMTYLMMKGGLRTFADYCEAMKDELPDIFDDLRPHLKSLYAAAQNMEEVMQLGWDEEMDDRKTVKAFDVYNFDKPGAKDIIAMAQHTVDERTSQQQTDQIIQTLKDRRNDQRKKEADKTSADTEAVVNKAEAAADEVESKLEAATTEEDTERLSRSINKEIEEVNKQLALLGYYEADPVDKDFNEAYGYMRNAERKATQDAHRLATQLASDLGLILDPKDKVRKSQYGFGSSIARSNVAPAGGEVYITLPLSEGQSLSMTLSLDKNEPWRERSRDERYDEDLILTDIMCRVVNSKGGALSGRRIKPTASYDEMLSIIRRIARDYLPEDVVKPATPLNPQPGESAVDMAKRVAEDKKPKSPSVEPQLPIGDLFGGLFDAPQSAKPEPAKPERPSKAKSDQLSTLLTQHKEMKKKHPDALLVFRVGNNYQILMDDAAEAANILSLPVSQFAHEGGEVPFVEFPHHSLDTYLPKMIRGGKRVAICEQLEEPKRTVKRESKSQTPKSNQNEKTAVQPRTEEGGRGGQQPRPNEPLGESAKHEDERTDGGRVAQRGGEHPVSDTERGTGVSGQRKSERSVEQPKNPRNNHVERGVEYAPKGEKARIDANLAAIRLAKELIASGATATPEQMAILRKYSGWGGLGSAFNEGNAWTPNPINKQLREILTPEEYEAAVMSRNSAYFTPAPIIDAMWDIAKALGFKGGNVVEGSAGIGKIIGQMPTDLSARSNIHAVEIDNTTGDILSLLYPDAKVDVQGFEATHIPNGSVDLAITNVPFVTDLSVFDESGDGDLSKNFRDIHDFCIAKNVRKLREGGIGIFITSSGTLDKSQKLRNWLVGDKEGCADVVAAFRMNNQTFGGASVTSDIIVVRKRVNGRKSVNAIDVSTVTPVRTLPFEDNRGKTKDYPLFYNRYFVEHPEFMGGEMAFNFERGITRYPTSVSMFPTATADQPARMAAWVEHLAKMDWSKEQGTAAVEQTSQINEELGKGVKEGSMITDSEGRLCVARMGQAVPLSLNKNKIKGRTKEECFKDYTEIKDALAEVLKYQTEHDDDTGLQSLLDRLNNAYDTFVQRYGNLNKNNNLAWLRNDVDFSSIVALETYSEKGTKDGSKVKTYGKTDIFSRRVVEKESEPAPKNVKDGIIASLYKFGRIDAEYLATQLGKSQEDVKQEIIESGLGFEDPMTGQMEVSYEYLSSNVREKLRQAREVNETSGGAFEANIKALEAVVPMNIPAHLIEFALGSSWIEPQLYEKFIKERTDLDVKLTNAGGTWHMNEPWNTDTDKNNQMGIRSESLGILIPGHKLIEAALTNKTITVSKTIKDSDGSHTETDPAATTACATKVDEIRQDFKDWAREQMQADPALSMRMEEKYNEKFNNSVPKSIPDEFVPEHFGGAATMVGGKPFRLRPHQAKAVIRATTQPVLLAHEVGTGKTYTLITTAMEMRRLGTARKPMIVVQNATVGQFVASAKALYPNAKVLTLEDADRNAEGRRAFYAKIKFNDWDMIVVPQSVFERIPDSIERQTQFIQDKIEEKMLVLEQMKDADPDGRSQIVRAAEREIARLEDEMSQLANGEPTDKKKEKDAKRAVITRQNAEVKAKELLDRAIDDVEDFDCMGIDAILVDEAHEYKHLGFATAMQRGVKGIDPSPSKKSQGVFLKTQAVLEKTGGKNVVFATGTPISNTAAEIWTFMRYLMPADVMKDYGIYYFDDFVRNFGSLQQMLEFKTNGKYDEVNRFAGYFNLPELVRIWSTVADTVLTREAGGVSDKIPQMEGDKAQDIFLPQTRALRSIMKYVKEELDKYDKMTGKEKKENSHIPLVMYGIAKAAAVDARLVQSDADDDPNSKTNEAVRQTLRTLEETKEYKGTVAIFADNYQNKASGFNLYEDIRKKLIAAGIPEEQVVVMKSGMSVNKKLEIFSRVNAGEVRVVMGSTFTLGTGVNIQERLHTLIHLDAPNRPMDYTQRNGRILRQGNLHNTWGLHVRVLRFGVEDSLDVTAYQRLKTKGAIADSIMNGKQLLANSMENRSLEEDQDLFGDITAQLSGSEYAMLKNQIEKEVRKLTAKYKAWKADQTYIHNRKRQIAGQNKEAEKRIADNKAYLAKVEAATIGDITVGKLSFPSMEDMEDFFTEQNKKKAEMQEQVRTSGYSSRPATSDLVVSVGGFNFNIHTEISRETKQGQQGDLFYSAPAKMTYSCPELGIDAMPVKGNVIKNAVSVIMEDVVSGNDFRERIEAAERYVERNNADLQSISARDGVPFQFTEELSKAEEKLEEYEELMKKEMEAKEAKYAELDKDVEAASNIELTEEDSDGTTSEPSVDYSAENANFASRYETADGKTINYTSENPEAYGGLFDFDFRDENISRADRGRESERVHGVDMRSGANDLQRQSDSELYRGTGLRSRLDEKSGEFSKVERVFTESGSFNFTSGEKIESAGDVAYIFSSLEDAAKEHSFIVLVRNGNPTVVELGMGAFTATMVDLPTASLAYNRIRPDQVYFVHNHPSGNLVCSPQDVQMLKKLAEISDVPVMGVIINLKTGKYGTFDTSNNTAIGQKRIPEKENALTVHTLDKQIFDADYDPMSQPLVRSSIDIANFLNSHRMGDRAKISFLILSRANRIVGNIHTPFTKISDNTDEMARYIAERVIQLGGEKAVIYGDFEIFSSESASYNKLKNRIEAVGGHTTLGGPTLLDIVRVEGNHTRSAMDEGLLYEPGSEYGASADGDIRFREVEDEAVLTEFAEGRTVKAYRTMQVIDGKLYSPMATKVGGKTTPEIKLGVPEQAEEHPEIIKETAMGRDGVEQGYVIIDKGLGKGTLKVAYNPYVHASRTVLNDQFSSAYIRPNLVVVEVEVPESELTNGYRANMAKDAVGEISWHSGSVSGQLSAAGKPRRVILTRYDRPVRIVPFGEVAEMIAEQLDGTDIAIPYNVVQPQLRSELERLGVAISEAHTGKVANEADFGRAEYITDQEIERINATQQEMAQTSPEAKSNHAAKLSEKFNTPIRVVNDLNELTHSDPKRQEGMRKAKGFYDVTTGNVVVVVPNNASVEDIAETVFHEVVAHKGLRDMIGEENYDVFCDEIYNHLKDDLKKEVDNENARRFINDPGKGYDYHRRVAVDEMLGRMSEKGFEDFTKAERGIWAKLKAKVLEAINKFLGSLKLPKWVKLGDNELRYILWRSHERLRTKSDYVDMARDAAKRHELGLDQNDAIRVTEADRIEEANLQFNEQLQHWESGRLSKNAVITAGLPMGLMRHFMPEDKIIIRQKVLTKAKKKHELTAREMINLPGALAHPIFVFKSNPETLGILTELKSSIGQNLFVAVEIGVNKQLGHRTVEVNDILSIHGRESANIILPIIENNSLIWVDKKKGLEWLSSAKTNSQAIATQSLDDTAKVTENSENTAHVDKEKIQPMIDSLRMNPGEAERIWLDLDSATKIVGNFDNPHFPNAEKVRKGVSQRDLSLLKSEHLTSVTDGATLSDFAKLPKFFDNPAITEEESFEYRFRDGETSDIWKDHSVGLEERITNAALRLSNNQSRDLTLRNEAMNAVINNLQSLVHEMRNKRGVARSFLGADRKVAAQVTDAMNAQAMYDRSTVKRVTDLARILMKHGYLSGMTSGEVQRLLSAVKNATAMHDISDGVQKIMDIMINNQLRNAEDTLHRLLSIRGSKVDARGVEVQGVLDVDGQRTMEVVKKAMSLSEDDINDRIAEALNRMSDPDNTIADQAALEYAGLHMALEYVQNVANSKTEEKTLRDELKRAKEDKDAGRMTDDAYKQFVDATENAIRKNKIERAEAYFNLAARLSDSIRDSIENAKAFREAEKARVNEIHHNANSDMEGRPINEHHEDDWKDKLMNNAFIQFFLAPLGTFDQILRVFGNKSASGEGYLWNRFMRGWVECRNKELTGVKEKFAQLDKKAAELFGKGKTWGDIIRMEGSVPKATVAFWDGGEMRDHVLTQGNLLYIYMVDKMTDGRMKLRRMGITEQNMIEIENSLDPRFKALGDWLQDEFLVGTRNEYNETHKRIFGASMAAIENYFPLKILKNARTDKEDDVNQQNQPDGITTKTGSIIKRHVNNLALDITRADALSVILDHITEMEHWNAYAEWNRDLNTLRTYKRFRNQVINMTTAYGGGRKLWEKFNDLCLMAAGEYRPPVSPLNKSAVNIAKGVTAAKVSFRMFTALKQLLSAPAYAPEVSTAAIVKSIAHPYDSFKWCMENLPIFHERWHSRISGDPRLLKSDMDWKMWRSRVMEISSRIGMTPNAFVDAVTVSIGAKAIYDTRLKQYLKEGYPADAAEKRAKQDATILFNQTQQSSESPFLSTMQVDKDWLSTMFTVFRNSSMSYTRQEYDAMRNLARNLTTGQRVKSIEFMTKQILRDWDVDPDDATDSERAKAEDAAKSRFSRQIKKDLIRVATFGFILQAAWNLGPYLPYIIFGNDSDEKDKMWDDALIHARFGSVEGLTGGDVMSSFFNMLASGDWNWNQLSKDMPLASDVNTIVTKFARDKNAEAMNDIINLVVQMGAGMNPQSITDAVIAITDACGDDPALSHEAALFIMRVLQVPQSQLDKLYFDEIDLSGKEASKLSPEQLAHRYAQYKIMRGASLSPWIWGEEERMDKYMQTAEKKMMDRLEHQGDSKSVEAYINLEEKAKTVNKKEQAVKDLLKKDYIRGAEAYAALQEDPDYERSKMFNALNQGLKRITKLWFESETTKEAILVATTIPAYRAAMVKVMQAETSESQERAMEELTAVINAFYSEYQEMQPELMQ
ncbi:MAG: hypothetical protein HDS81_00600 [Bacteroidales bacterium]|nr:hypothetical protein [Bacteroidales bacterium]